MGKDERLGVPEEEGGAEARQGRGGPSSKWPCTARLASDRTRIREEPLSVLSSEGSGSEEEQGRSLSPEITALSLLTLMETAAAAGPTPDPLAGALIGVSV